MAQSLKDLDKAFAKMLEKFPEARRETVEQAGKKMHERVQQNILKDVYFANGKGHKHMTGRLLEGAVLAIGSGGGYAAVRNDAKIAPHAHLIENGHNIVKGGPLKPTKKQQAAGVQPGKIWENEEGKKGWINGKFMYRNAMNALEEELIQDAEEMIEKLAGDLF